MTTATLAKLERLRNYSTRYELAATHTDGRKVLIGYTPRRNRAGLWSMLTKNAGAWVKFSGVEDLTFGKRAADGGKAGDWTINFSGRTQREAIMNGELPFFISA